MYIDMKHAYKISLYKHTCKVCQNKKCLKKKKAGMFHDAFLSSSFFFFLHQNPSDLSLFLCKANQNIFKQVTLLSTTYNSVPCKFHPRNRRADSIKEMQLATIL